jgi:hypothetical protein
LVTGSLLLLQTARRLLFKTPSPPPPPNTRAQNMESREKRWKGGEREFCSSSSSAELCSHSPSGANKTKKGGGKGGCVMCVSEGKKKIGIPPPIKINADYFGGWNYSEPTCKYPCYFTAVLSSRYRPPTMQKAARILLTSVRTSRIRRAGGWYIIDSPGGPAVVDRLPAASTLHSRP